MTKLISLLSQLVSIPSPTGNEHEIAKFITGFLREQDFQIQVVQTPDNRPNLLTQRGNDPHLLFLGHLDTVSANPSSWNTNPYTLVSRDDKLLGLGTYDMKGGIASMLSACANTSTPVKILLTSDEENISQGAWTVVQHHTSFFDSVNLIISSEPSFDLGLSGITTSRTGRCIFAAQFFGKSTHIAKYKESQDSIQLASHFCNQLYQERDKLFGSTGTVVQIRKFSAESNGMSVCADAQVEIETLISPTDSIGSVQSKLQSLTATPIEVKQRPTPYLDSYHFSTFPYQQLIGEIISTTTGQQMSLHHRQSVADDNVIATLGIPVITWGPEGNNAHTHNEFVTSTSLERLTTMYTKLLNSADTDAKEPHFSPPDPTN